MNINSSKVIRVETLRRKGARMKLQKETWEVSAEGHFRRVSPGASDWIDARMAKPRHLLEAIERLLLATVSSDNPPHWTTRPVLRSAVIAPTASLRSQVEVDDESR